ncbi:MAG TPA: M81 family metallopeptidase [bacterium]|nr:M81 family metallopeptidase [bacterium]
MRIAIGGLSHETNTFCVAQTEVREFKDREWSHGEALVARHRGVRDYLGGMLAAADERDIEVAPTFATRATPSGTIRRAAYEEMRGELLAGFEQAVRSGVDAICLALHGAGVAEGVDDIEGDILARVRGLAGPAVPIIVTLDLHANVTEEMARHATALLGVNEYPHVDSYERGAEAVGLAADTVQGRVRPRAALVRIPMLVPTTATSQSPVREINARCRDWERRTGVLDCTFFHGFAHTDAPVVAAAVVAVADGQPDAAGEAAADVARYAWGLREAFLRSAPDPAEAVRQALASEGRPVVINETSDNPGGGAPGDGTHLLRALLEARAAEACFGFLWDPETAAQAHAAGVGAVIRVRLGGKTDAMHGAPLETDAYVKCLSDGRFIQQSPMGRGARVDLGRMARLVIPAPAAAGRGGVDLLVSSVRSQTLDPEVFLVHGIDVARYRIVALKSSQHFRAGFEPIAARIITADSPGLTTLDLTTFPYRRLARPVWPLDDAARFPP